MGCCRKVAGDNDDDDGFDEDDDYDDDAEHMWWKPTLKLCHFVKTLSALPPLHPQSPDPAIFGHSSLMLLMLMMMISTIMNVH